jgi:hypothetical protein
MGFTLQHLFFSAYKSETAAICKFINPVLKRHRSGPYLALTLQKKNLTEHFIVSNVKR